MLNTVWALLPNHYFLFIFTAEMRSRGRTICTRQPGVLAAFYRPIGRYICSARV